MSVTLEDLQAQLNRMEAGINSIVAGKSSVQLGNWGGQMGLPVPVPSAPAPVPVFKPEFKTGLYRTEQYTGARVPLSDDQLLDYPTMSTCDFIKDLFGGVSLVDESKTIVNGAPFISSWPPKIFIEWPNGVRVPAGPLAKAYLRSQTNEAAAAIIRSILSVAGAK